MFEETKEDRVAMLRIDVGDIDYALIGASLGHA
jgi:hypothetical protein